MALNGLVSPGCHSLAGDSCLGPKEAARRLLHPPTMGPGHWPMSLPCDGEALLDLIWGTIPENRGSREAMDPTSGVAAGATLDAPSGAATLRNQKMDRKPSGPVIVARRFADSPTSQGAGSSGAGAAATSRGKGSSSRAHRRGMNEARAGEGE